MSKKENIRYKKKENNENKSNNLKEEYNNKKLNNFFDDIDDLNEDNIQKLNLKPSPIYQPNKKITFEKRKKYALQKKTNTERINNETEEENIYLDKNNTCYENEKENDNDNDLINNLMISSGSVDSKIKKERQIKIEDKLLGGIKKSFEDNNNENECNNNSQENENFNYNKKNDTKRIDEDEDNSLEAPQEEIKIEINREMEKKNNDINIHHNENEIEQNNNEEYSNNNSNYTNLNNKIDDLSTYNNTNAVDNIYKEQENIISSHIEVIKEEAKLLSEEGNLISKIKGIGEGNYSIEEYMPKIEEIIHSKLSYFKELKQKIKEYKSLLKPV